MGKNRFLGANVTGVLKSLIAFAISFQISFGANLAYAADSGEANIKPKEYSVFLPKEIEKLSAEDFLKTDSQFTENEKLFIEKYFNEPSRVTLDLMLLARALIDKADSVQDAADKIKSRNSDQEIAVEIPGLGKAEYNSLGYKDSGKIFTRFVHYGTGTSYIYLDENIVPLNKLTEAEKLELGIEKSKDEARVRQESNTEANRYIALQQMHTKVHPEEYNPFPDLEEVKPEEAKDYVESLVKNAKENPPKKRYDTNNKIKTGRLVKVIVYNGKDQVVKSITEHQRYEDLSPLQRVSIYWKSIKQGTRLNWEYWDHGSLAQKPLTFLTGDVLVSMFSTVMQTGVFAVLKQTTDPLSLLLVGGWAFAFSITPTARNWINVNSSKSAVLFKSFLNSVVFNYIMLVAIHGADTVFSLDKAALNLAFLSITNAIINNFGKVWWYKIPQMRQRAGLNLREVNILGLRTKVDQSSFEQQAWYLGSNIVRTADLIAMGTLFSILSIEFTISRVVMLLSIPTLHYAIMKYSEKRDFKEKKILRQEWEKANYLHWDNKPVLLAGHKIPILYLGSAKMFAQETWIIAKNSAKLIYWPGKVVFDGLVAGTRSLVRAYNAAAAQQSAPVATPHSLFDSAPPSLACKNLFL